MRGCGTGRSRLRTPRSPAAQCKGSPSPATAGRCLGRGRLCRGGERRACHVERLCSAGWKWAQVHSCTVRTDLSEDDRSSQPLREGKVLLPDGRHVVREARLEKVVLEIN